MKERRKTAENTKPLSMRERKARVADSAKSATGKAKKGMELIDFRDPTPEERALGETLDGKAEKALARYRTSKAA